MGRILRFNPRRKRRRFSRRLRPVRFGQRSQLREALYVMRPLLALVVLSGGVYFFGLAGVISAPGFLSSEPEVVNGRFTRCGPGRGHYCVIDGDTFKIGRISVRVVGIDTAERDARCEAEARQAEASTLHLKDWLNRGPFEMTARLDRPTDRYGRELRTITRPRPDGTEDALADYMRSEGGARGYWGGWRGGWC